MIGRNNEERDLRRRLDPKREEINDEILADEAGMARWALQQRMQKAAKAAKKKNRRSRRRK